MPRATLQLKLKTNDLIAGKWQVLKKLGEGGCGSVYRCKPAKGGGDSDEVAVKVLENASDLPRFRREKKVLSSIRHAHVVKLLDSGSHEGHPYLVLEYMEGGSVRDLMDDRRLTPEESCWVMVQVVRGLRASRTVHRDLKPENLLLGRGIGRNGTLKLAIDDIKKGGVVKVADFGLAKHHDPSATRLTNTGQVMGTPVYMSPEQCRNTRTVNFRSDMYSLGIILFEMVTGKAPFEANNAYDIMAMHCNDTPKYPRMDPRVKAVCERCLAKNPKDRYPSLYALERDLAQIAGLGEPEPDRASWLTWVIVAIVLATLVAVGWFLRDDLLQAFNQWWEKFRR